FTLVELLVVIAIIGMLIGLLLPAVNNAREQGRRMTCSSQVRQLAQAVQQYELTRRMYPGYSNFVPMLQTSSSGSSTTIQSVTSPSGLPGASFLIELLPNLERNDLYQAWRTSSTSAGTTGVAATAASAQVVLNILLCPTNPPATSGGTPLSYVVNSGCVDAGTYGTAGSQQRDYRENGVFHDRYTGDPRVAAGGGGSSTVMPRVTMTSDFITSRDGMSNTLMFSENADAGNYTDVTETTLGFIWDANAQPNGTQNVVPGGPPPTAQPTVASYRPNDATSKGQAQFSSGTGGSGSGSSGSSGSGSVRSSYNWTRPSSYHQNGMNVVFCDARTTFMSDQIEYYVYCLLMSPDGKNVRNPTSPQTTLLQSGKNFAVPIDDSWIP
ncbi:MAG TPA: DUF1559 domain-containing protein, partial [Pirellulales bacterium]|nr:DUF1559 domain-containing protein [Pirellulales bacterium]